MEFVNSIGGFIIPLPPTKGPPKSQPNPFQNFCHFTCGEKSNPPNESAPSNSRVLLCVHLCDSSCFDRSIHGGGVELSSFGEQVVDDGGVDVKFSEEEEDDCCYYFELHAQQ